MTTEQLEALMEYVRSAAEREAVLAACGSDEGGYARNLRAAEIRLREVMLTPNASLTGGEAVRLKRLMGEEGVK